MQETNQNFDGFSAALIAWQKKYGRHGLPWMVKDPYKRWLSEVMLQQTQVSVVCEYFGRFIAAYPTLPDLAKATEEDVMRLWAGLGYYSRARNLLKCAKTIDAKYGGKFPTTREELMTLPGIGKSTAGAIASFSFGSATPILDGNVRRIFARLLTMKDPVEKASSQKTLWALAEKLVPKKNTGIYNQALMDLGASLCSRTQPQCKDCPIRKWCKAALQGNPAKYPVRLKTQAKPTRDIAMVLYLKGDKLWLTKREKKAVWQGLWSLPEVDFVNAIPVAHFHHAFSHYEIEVNLYAKELNQNEEPEGNGKWISWSEVEAEALPSPVRRVLLQIRSRI